MTDFLERMNLALLETEQRLHSELSQQQLGTKDLPSFYFVIGAPRSGTTLLTQLLAYCYDFGYITNLAARFWMNPVTGIRLSREVLGDTVPSFESKYANTSLPGDIHEFGRFWMAHLGISSAQDVDWMVPDAEHAGLTLRALRAIQSEFGKPIVMKGIYPAYAYEWLNEQLGDQIKWINLSRDFNQTCLSVRKARQNRMGDIKKWFGWHIPKSDRGEITGLFPMSQIASQVFYFQWKYCDIVYPEISYSGLCDDPWAALKWVVGENPKRDPPKLKASRHPIDEWWHMLQKMQGELLCAD